MKVCEHCGKTWPDHLVARVLLPANEGSGTPFLDLICALKKNNEIHKLPEGTPFRGPKAQALYLAAVEYAKAQGWDANALHAEGEVAAGNQD